MKIAIVILNWNGRHLLEKFLPVVLEHSAEQAAVYVADNASTDDSVAFLGENFPQVKIIRNSTNGGYAKGYNEALQHVSEELFVLMNSDIATSPGWLNPIIEAFKADASLGAAQPKILDLKRPDYFEYAGAGGGFIDSFGYPFCRGRLFETLEKDEGQYDDSLPVFWASGACLVIRKKAFYDANGLDETFFAHQEEIDLCWRVRALGYAVYHIGSSSVYHLGGATLEQMNPQKTYLNFRNGLMLLLKNVPGLQVYAILFFRMCLDGIAALKFLAEGKPKHSFAILRAHFSFYKKIPQTLGLRRNTPKLKAYSTTFSIVWKYFVLGKKYYTDIFPNN
ncbi:glycosyltransferase family 2 protein [Leeuwenhoekiella nanhaiensis]|uniref:dTDP-Rha--alpha-D-GlcNAc-pyrophosphate polyprenol alpha-3-L-rhamnosyltransferase n=1 Tax=Leeuwenhoekiella nanhaiensis TaxID=1655491 RepID=A0A2G1VSA8_9FLAO|nr:glycosyltransferase family 2 protein [Leeuwenhoekiella nanhaiensis]PHQ29339.1 dTDP-Rha--alpha-D-GlcNAc-pyrophosphate polyprenol alpha-3-L-rhamnosyltransferase [Leeuwenhoekiella nanhaiensis]